MFKRFQRLRISLATKCQILFGASVVLIIAAALAVPWQRMEHLTLQLNERSAAALADNTLAEHIVNQRLLAKAPSMVPASPAAPTSSTTISSAAASAASPTSAPSPHDLAAPETLDDLDGQVATTRKTTPTTQPSSTAEPARPARRLPPLIPELLVLPPRLLSIAASDDSPEGNVPALTHFEKRAISHFRRHPDSDSMSDGREDPERYRYAQAVYLTQECVACHVPMDNAGTETTTSAPTFQRLTRSADSDFPLVALPVERSRLVGVISVDIPTRVQENQLLLNRIFIMTAGLLAGSLAILCFYLIVTRLILQPVRVLQETAEKVSKGDLNIRSDISTGDEFQQLAETFNVMLANLKQTTDQLRSINSSLDLKVSQLAEANLALYESNRLKSEFLANVSHELRTPLNSILGFADLLRDALGPIAGAPEAKPARYVNNILLSGKHLLELINDLLDLAKIEAGRMEVRSEPLSLTDLFEGLTNILKPLCEVKRLTIATSIGTDVPILHTDPGKLQQVLYNFLSNAIKFSPSGGRIDLVARRESGAPNATSNSDDSDLVRISVTDEGPGIAVDSQQLIFEKFRQVDASVTRTHGGSGLGLAISKELTALIAGAIGVRSAAGQGATFWIAIPLRIEASTQDLRGKLVLS